MGSAKDFPQIIQSLKWTWFAKNDHIQPAVVVTCRGYKGKAQSIARCVEHENRCAGQNFLGSGVMIRTVIGGNRYEKLDRKTGQT